MQHRYALQVQSLPTAADQTLAIADLVALRSERGRFSAAEVISAFYALSVPPPGNVSREIGRLRDRGRAIRHPDGGWSLTPAGKLYLEGIAVDSAASVAAVEQGAPSAEFAHVDHTVIPHWAAPPRWAPGIARLLERSPFDGNVLCMTRFPSEGGISDPVAAAITVARATLEGFGLTLHLASDAIVDDDLLGNVGAYIWGCRYGLGFVEDRVGRGVNYNAVIEIGGMALTGRRCGVLLDRTVPSLPTDLSGHIYRSVDLEDGAAVSEQVGTWARRDLGLRTSS